MGGCICVFVCAHLHECVGLSEYIRKSDCVPVKVVVNYLCLINFQRIADRCSGDVSLDAYAPVVSMQWRLVIPFFYP